MYSGLKLDNFLPELLPVDSSVKLFLKDEANRQEENIELIASVITGGADNHLFILDFSKTRHNLSGKDVQDALDEHKITANKNCVPKEQRSPTKASGLRIGTPAMTTKGWLEKDFIERANKIHKIIEGLDYGKNKKR